MLYVREYVFMHVLESALKVEAYLSLDCNQIDDNMNTITYLLEYMHVCIYLYAYYMYYIISHQILMLYLIFYRFMYADIDLLVYFTKWAKSSINQFSGERSFILKQYNEY